MLAKVTRQSQIVNQGVMTPGLGLARSGLAFSDAHRSSVQRQSENKSKVLSLSASPEIVQPVCSWAEGHPTWYLF